MMTSVALTDLYTPMKRRSEHFRYLLFVSLFCVFAHQPALCYWKPTQRAQERPKQGITGTSSSHINRMA